MTLMNPVTVFLRTLLKSSAIFIGATAIFLHPALEWRGTAVDRTAVGAQQGAREAAVAGLIALLKDPEPGVRAQAADTLAQLEAHDAVDALIAAVKDTNTDVRRHVVDALGEIGDAKALDALTRALKDDDAGVRRHAAAAIAEVSGNGTGPRPHPHPHPHPHPLPVRAGVR
jgi:HEAT repeat protein